MSDFIFLLTKGVKKVDNSDPNIDYEGLNIKRPSPEEEPINIRVSIRKECILYFREQGIDADVCIIGTDYGIEYTCFIGFDDLSQQLT